MYHTKLLQIDLYFTYMIKSVRTSSQSPGPNGWTEVFSVVEMWFVHENGFSYLSFSPPIGFTVIWFFVVLSCKDLMLYTHLLETRVKDKVAGNMVWCKICVRRNISIVLSVNRRPMFIADFDENVNRPFRDGSIEQVTLTIFTFLASHRCLKFVPISRRTFFLFFFFKHFKGAPTFYGNLRTLRRAYIRRQHEISLKKQNSQVVKTSRTTPITVVCDGNV